jgi:hypothetical protein
MYRIDEFTQNIKTRQISQSESKIKGLPNPYTILEQPFFTKVRIETTLNDETLSTGTGFIFNYRKSNADYPFIVINRHVIKDSVNGYLLFNRMKNNLPKFGDHFSLECCCQAGY